jgi:hypothetical protein
MVDRHTNTHTETKSKYLDGHGRLSQSEENECMWAHNKDGITRVLGRCHQGVARGMDGGKFKRRLSEVIARAVSRWQNEFWNEKYVFLFVLENEVEERKSLTASNEDDIQDTFHSIIMPKKRKRDAQTEALRKKRRSMIDKEHYIPYTAADHHTEQG